jgi:hypothetical protein
VLGWLCLSFVTVESRSRRWTGGREGDESVVGKTTKLKTMLSSERWSNVYGK